MNVIVRTGPNEMGTHGKSVYPVVISEVTNVESRRIKNLLFLESLKNTNKIYFCYFKFSTFLLVKFGCKRRFICCNIIEEKYSNIWNYNKIIQSWVLKEVVKAVTCCQLKIAKVVYQLIYALIHLYESRNIIPVVFLLNLITNRYSVRIHLRH